MVVRNDRYRGSLILLIVLGLLEILSFPGSSIQTLSVAAFSSDSSFSAAVSKQSASFRNDQGTHSSLTPFARVLRAPCPRSTRWHCSGATPIITRFSPAPRRILHLTATTTTTTGRTGYIGRTALTRGMQICLRRQPSPSQRQHRNRFSHPLQLLLLPLWSSSSDDNSNDDATMITVDPLIPETSRILKRLSWFSWWSQMILTTISAVLLLFARNVSAVRYRGMSVSALSQPNFAWSAVGLLLSILSIIWTWGNGSRLSRRWFPNPNRNDLGEGTSTPSTTIKITTTSGAAAAANTMNRIQVARMLRRAVRVGVSLNLLGLLINLLAAEQIVGALAVKVLSLTTGGGAAGGWSGPGSTGLYYGGAEGLQPIDVLVVQANTNLLLSHFCSLVCLLYLTDRVVQLDPPGSASTTKSNPTHLFLNHVL